MLAAALAGLGPARAAAAEPTPPPQLPPAAPAPLGDQPRRGLRVAVDMGFSLYPSQICDGCIKFSGRGFGVGLEVGWTIRPEWVVVLSDRGGVIPFADGTDGGTLSLEAGLLHFWSARGWGRAGLGLGFWQMEPDPGGGETWRYPGGSATVGLGYDVWRVRILSFYVESSATGIQTKHGFASAFLALAGLSWN
jgi:hypothetical protein